MGLEEHHLIPHIPYLVQKIKRMIPGFLQVYLLEITIFLFKTVKVIVFLLVQ